MRWVEKRGRTTEEAVAAALEELGAERDAVTVEILEEARSGLFGLLGTREALVRVGLRPTRVEYARELLGEILPRIVGVLPEIASREEPEQLVLEIPDGEWAGLLIGRHGETLEALQYLLVTALQQAERRGEVRPSGRRLLLDVAGYRRRREETIQRLVRRAAANVRRTGQPERLEPMTAYERKLVHTLLTDEPDLESRSEGEEPHRQVIIFRREGEK